MQKDPNDRSLTGQEQQQERITVKKLENSIKKIEFEIWLNIIEKERLDLENEEKKLQIVNITERRDKGKLLIGGAKIIDVFPPAKPTPEDEKAAQMLKDNPVKDLKEKGNGGEKGEGKI